MGELNLGSRKAEDGIDAIIATLIEMLGSIPTKFLFRDEHKNYKMVSFSFNKEEIEINLSPLTNKGESIKKNEAVEIFKMTNKGIEIKKAVFSTKHAYIR